MKRAKRRTCAGGLAPGFGRAARPIQGLISMVLLIAASATGGGNELDPLAGQSPIVVRPPASQQVYTGNECVFSVTADGTPPLVYQWRRDTADLPGETNSQFTLPAVQTSDAGSYSVLVSNAFGWIVSSSAVLAVLEAPPQILVQPANHPFQPGAAAVFAVQAEGSAPLRYQWRFKGREIAGATEAVLQIPSAQCADLGRYTVTVANRFGTLISTSAVLHLPVDYEFAAPGDPLLWDFNGTNSAIFPCAYSAVLNQDAAGRIGGDLTGKITGNGAVVRLRLSGRYSCWETGGDQNGIWIESRSSWALVLDTPSQVLFGQERGRVRRTEIVSGQRTSLGVTSFGRDVLAPLPEGVAGHWKLSLQLVPEARRVAGAGLLALDQAKPIELEGNKVWGLATITLAGGVVIAMDLRGVYLPQTQKAWMWLRGVGVDRGASLVVWTQGPELAIHSIRGKVAGQRIRLDTAHPASLVPAGFCLEP